MRLPLPLLMPNNNNNKSCGESSTNAMDCEEGDLVIDEGRGQLEISTYSNNRGDEVGDESGGGRNGNNGSPPNSYEQIGHSFGKPSSSALSLLANSRKQGGGGTRYLHPYLARRESVEGDAGGMKETQDFISSYGANTSSTSSSSSSLVQSSGIWTPSSVVVATSSDYGGSGGGGGGSSYEEYNTSPSEQPPLQQQHTPSSEQIVPSSGGSGGESSGGHNMSMVRGGGAAGYLYDMTINNHYNHTHHQSHAAYKVEGSSPSRTPAYLLHPPHGESPILPESHVKNAFFTQDKVDTLCDVMLRDKNYTMLESILAGLSKDIHDSENVLRARAALAWYNGDYNLLYDILDSRIFSSRHHKELQDLYQSARYTEAGKMRGRSLGAVDKYRIRRKFSLPRTIWDGESTSYTFKDRDRKMLIDAYRRCQYPNGEVKKELQLLTGLDKKQIDNWFKNRRQRDRPLDQKPRKSKMPHLHQHHLLHPHSPRDGGLVLTPASSAGSSGSNSTLLYTTNMPYHNSSPTSTTLIMGAEDSMDVKYSPSVAYNNNNGGGNVGVTPTLAQIKSYHHSPPLPLLQSSNKKGAGGKKTGTVHNKSNNNSSAWAKGAAALVGEKVGKRNNRKVKGGSGGGGVESMHVNGGGGGGEDHPHHHIIYSTNSTTYADHLYGSGGGGGGCRSNKGGGGGEEEEDSNPSSSFQQYSSSSTLMLNHHHHHHQGMGVAMGWPSEWQSAAASMAVATSSSTSINGSSTEPHPCYSPMTILPSLAASFNNHSHHSHPHHSSHSHHGINAEARIQVQA